MKWLLLAGIWVMFLGCVNGSETENTVNETPMGNTPGPGLYTELDSIVINQWDYAYSRAKFDNADSTTGDTTIFSASAMRFLTSDTALFLKGKAYDFSDEGYDIFYVKTKFNPKGWNAFIDRKYEIRCAVQSDTLGMEAQNWLVLRKLDESNWGICKERGQQFLVTQYLHTYHYHNLGFSFDPVSQIGGFDRGQVRIYYWR